MVAEASVLVVDDDPSILKIWERVLGDFKVHSFGGPIEAAAFVQEEDVDAAVIDIEMPGMSGLELLKRIHSARPHTEIIVASGQGTVQQAVTAMKLGAYDYFAKPFAAQLESHVRMIKRAVERKQLREAQSQMSKRLDALGPNTILIGDSQQMVAVRDTIDRISESNATVLVTGESGTGKELVARSLHARTTGGKKPWVAINCAAIPETLIDSELFGHTRGSFSGATSDHKGVFEAAHGGVLFLDEIGDMPLATQVRLLRTLQEGEVRPVGATRAKQVSVKVVAATNVDLSSAIREGSFREDLFYRISTFQLALPPLRDRPSDIPMLAAHLLKKRALRDNLETKSFSMSALEHILRHRWPGNVRELANTVEHAATLAPGDVIELEHLPAYLNTDHEVTPARGFRVSNNGETEVYSSAKNRALRDFEHNYLATLLSQYAGNISECSRRSGIDRANLRRLLKKHSLSAEAYR